ncbi:nephrocystin-3 protein [Ceratobasidium sp. AG-Ba]|nr:nephrocystin-3 protein [Ceratobasidium sp. AG-Ba]
MTTASPLSENEVINALSCDAGSIASLLATIEVVGEVMKGVQKQLGLSEPPKPSKYFKLMVGAGFSGLLVVLLGRLDLSVEEAKRHCIAIMDDAFSERKLLSKEVFKATRLKSAIERMLKSCGFEPDMRMADPRADGSQGCKVMVCVSPESGMRAGVPVRLRTYDSVANSLPDCTIVEAVCATFAVPGLFKPTEVIEPGGIKSTYIGLGDFSPTVELLDETVNIFKDGQVGCIASIGARQSEVSAKQPERVAQEMARRFMHRPGIYFRFYVGQGMEAIRMIDWDKRSGGTRNAQAYLRLQESTAMVAALVNSLTNCDASVPTGYLGTAIPSPLKNNLARQCPPPSPLFVGREQQLSKMSQYLGGEAAQRRIFVLHGLGGVGKTQLALKFVELYKNDYQYVFYIDCTSTNTLNADLISIARERGVGETADDALTWLANIHGNWLMVYNNADDITINLRGYFPPSPHGSIIITTRNRGAVNLAHDMDAACQVTAMPDEEARELLNKAAGLTNDSDKATLDELIRAMGYFPLAIVQAGAYIRTHTCSLKDYLEMYQKSQGQLLEEYADEVQKIDDYERTVYATWQLSYRQLTPLAGRLFDVMAFMHHDHILEDTFRLALMGLRDGLSPLTPTADEARAEQFAAELLTNFTTLVDGTWNKSTFLRTLNNLASYSLITYDPIGRSYSIHPLVQRWARTVVTDPATIRGCTASLLAWSVIEYKETKEDLVYRRILLGHIDSLPGQEKRRPRLAGRFWTIYMENGRIEDGEPLVKAENEANLKALGRHHPYTLLSTQRVALALFRQGRPREAESLQREVLQVGKKVWGSEHPETLTAMSCLAKTYGLEWRWKEAEVLFREVVEIGKRVRSNGHVRSLRAASNLAGAYSMQGKFLEAEAIIQETLAVAKQELGDDHPETLRYIEQMSTIYGEQEKWAEAEALAEESLESAKRVYGDQHAMTLKAMTALGETYFRQDRLDKAEVLQAEVVKMAVAIWGSEHPGTLDVINGLAKVQGAQGRHAEAEALLTGVVEIQKQTQGKEHPATLMAMGNLGKTYSKQGRWADAEKLQKEVLESGYRVWGSGHPYTLLSKGNLAETYSGQERWTEAEILQREVVEANKRAYVPPKIILQDMSSLAMTLSKQERWAEAKALYQEAVEVGKRVWGSDDPKTLSVMHSLASSLRHLGKLRKAESLISTVVDSQRRVLGDSHIKTIESLQLLEEIRRGLEEKPGDYAISRLLMYLAIVLIFVSWLLYKVSTV